jgi:hypothetical protein
MPMHLIAFAGTKTDSTANEAAPVIPDGTLTPSAVGQSYIMPWDGTVLMASAMNDTITRARLSYPSIRDFGLPEIFPLIALAEPSADYDLYVPGWVGPRFKRGDDLGVDTSNGASTVDNVIVTVLLGDMALPVPAGRRTTIRGTSAQTLVANRWTNGGITLDQGLPSGTYAVIGMQCACNDAAAARLIFPNMLGYRPGLPTGETIAILDPRQTGRAGQFGEWGRFQQTAPPQLELLGSTAGAETAAVILDLVQIGGASG